MEKICKFVRCQFSWRVQHKSTHCLHSLFMNQSHLLFSFQVPDQFLDVHANIFKVLIEKGGLGGSSTVEIDSTGDIHKVTVKSKRIINVG